MRPLVDAVGVAPRVRRQPAASASSTAALWQSRAVQSGILRVATQDELALAVCSMPGIDQSRPRSITSMTTRQPAASAVSG